MVSSEMSMGRSLDYLSSIGSVGLQIQVTETLRQVSLNVMVPDAMTSGSIFHHANGSTPQHIDQEFQFLLAQGHVNTFHRGRLRGNGTEGLQALLDASQRPHQGAVGSVQHSRGATRIQYSACPWIWQQQQWCHCP